MGTVGNFDDIIAEFSKEYKAYIVTNITPRDDGSRQYTYKEVKIEGSLQPDGRVRIMTKSGANIIEHKWSLWATDKYILNDGDYVIDKTGNVLIITGLDPWEDEGDFRKYSLTKTKYSEKRLLDMFKGDIPNEEVDEELIEELESRMR